jgi:putative glycosyltransferase (TIGR04372 family)
MIKKFLYYLFYFFIFLPFFILILFIRLFIKFRIVELESRIIGHFSLPVEIFLCEIKLGIHGKSEPLVWFVNRKISNYFLYKKWKEVCFIGPRLIFEKIFILSNKIKFFGNIFLSPYRHWSRTTDWQAIDVYNVLDNSKPIIKFNKNEHDLANIFFKKSFTLVPEKYVCFFSRSHYYRGGDPCIRDSSVYTQLKGIKRVCNDNFYALRMSKVDKNNPLKNKNKKIFDYAYCNYKSDFLDIYLLYHCSYMISTGSGIEEVPKLNRKKILLVDYCDAKTMHRLVLVPIILPKKIINIKDGKLLNYNDIFSKDLLQPKATHDSLRKMGYDYLDNTEDEIETAIMEMHSHVIYEKKLKDDLLNRRFWDLYEMHYKKTRPKNTFVSPSFLKKNQNLLN